MSEKKQKQEKISVGLYPDILKRIDDEAERQHRSRSNMLDVILRKYFNIEIEESPTSQRPSRTRAN